jgi:hypothetical protein
VLQPFNTAWPDPIGFIDSDRLFAGTGRVLLFLASTLSVALPFTQHIWTWDRFLHGGHDFETNMLLILCTLCLVLVLMQLCRRAVSILFALRAWLPPWKSTSLRCASLPLACDWFNRPPVDARDIPLRI